MNGASSINILRILFSSVLLNGRVSSKNNLKLGLKPDDVARQAVVVVEREEVVVVREPMAVVVREIVVVVVSIAGLVACVA